MKIPATRGFAFLGEDSKRRVRRAILKAVALPGYQVPFPGREMPMPYGWGTGGIQVTASLIGPADVLKVIDQGADDTTNAVSIRAFFRRTAGAAVTEETARATIIQTRHRIPETPLAEGQIMVYQVPIPEPLRFIEPRAGETRALHALGEYGLVHLKLYEDIVRHGEIAQSYDYPVMTAGRYAMSPSPIPRFDNPKLDMSPALHLFGAGREKRIYAVPPYCPVRSFDFEDYPFKARIRQGRCALCGSESSYLDEVVVDDAGGRIFVCSDTDYCRSRLAAGAAAGEREAAPAGEGRGRPGGSPVPPAGPGSPDAGRSAPGGALGDRCGEGGPGGGGEGGATGRAPAAREGTGQGWNSRSCA
ncbi:MAG: alpha-D-ribose 1-methylphosphonate 5-phosphate C-P-lyase PhnJ [Deltaproteobacteria bacterium]|nr:alpha-D-ribose 1-methylphosphonate 5-phosphate C-P-lyase PhnJ [Deltaproteobacteria bacterium]